MNREMQLKLQAYLDGELSGRDARGVEEWVERDSEAKALLEELRFTKAFVSGHEPEVKLPESREFYWGKIQRAIEAAEPKPEATTTLAAVLWERFLTWRKYLVPLAATALVVFLTISTITFTKNNDSWRLATVENISEHTGSFSFRSQAENMFVVWVYEKPEPASESYEDIDYYEEDYWLYE